MWLLEQRCFFKRKMLSSLAVDNMREKRRGWAVLFSVLMLSVRQYLLGIELSLSSRWKMTPEVEEIFWFISHTLPQCHTLKGVGDTYL
jgi:hypothetical protein